MRLRARKNSPLCKTIDLYSRHVALAQCWGRCSRAHTQGQRISIESSLRESWCSLGAHRSALLAR
jgi:hypothetical protein